LNPETRDRARRLAEAARDRNAEDVVALAVGPLTSFADVFVLATAASDRQGRAIADAVREAARQCGMTLLGTEGYEDGRWILIDGGDVVVHVFIREAREHYDLDRLWGDAEHIELPERTAAAGAARST
jgi:ribosome-associated protein